MLRMIRQALTHLPVLVMAPGLGFSMNQPILAHFASAGGGPNKNGHPRTFK
jgi:hypothetical protein